MERWPTPQLAQRKNKMNLGFLFVPKIRKCMKNDEDVPKGPRNQIEGVLTGQIWYNLRTELILGMNYNPLIKIGNHESVQI